MTQNFFMLDTMKIKVIIVRPWALRDKNFNGNVTLRNSSFASNVCGKKP